MSAALLLGLTVAAVVWVMWQAPLLLTDGNFKSHADRMQAVNAARQPLATALLAMGASVTAIFTASGFFLSRRNTERDHQLAREAQVTDRFNDAITNLGAGAMHIRMGGVYALQRIGLDSDRDRTTMIAVLSSFVRIPPQVEGGPTEVGKDAAVALDVKAAIEVVMGLSKDGDAPLDLRGAKLNGLDLRRLSLARANCSDANLRSATLSSCDMREADLGGADLRKASLAKADLQGATTDRTYLHGADLSGADVRNTDLSGAFGLTVEQLAAAETDIKTKVPPALATSN